MVSTAAFHARVRGSVPGLGGLKETKLFLPHPRVKVSIVGSLRDREVACSASDRQGSNFESCVWRTVSSQSSHHPQEVLLAQFSIYVHKGGLKPDSFHFILSKLKFKKSSLLLIFSERPAPLNSHFWPAFRVAIDNRFYCILFLRYIGIQLYIWCRCEHTLYAISCRKFKSNTPAIYTRMTTVSFTISFLTL